MRTRPTTVIIISWRRQFSACLILTAGKVTDVLETFIHPYNTTLWIHLKSFTCEILHGNGERKGALSRVHQRIEAERKIIRAEIASSPKSLARFLSVTMDSAVTWINTARYTCQNSRTIVLRIVTQKTQYYFISRYIQGSLSKKKKKRKKERENSIVIRRRQSTKYFPRLKIPRSIGYELEKMNQICLFLNKHVS